MRLNWERLEYSHGVTWDLLDDPHNEIWVNVTRDDGSNGPTRVYAHAEFIAPDRFATIAADIAEIVAMGLDRQQTRT